MLAERPTNNLSKEEKLIKGIPIEFDTHFKYGSMLP
jgi:hypothetical protein